MRLHHPFRDAPCDTGGGGVHGATSNDGSHRQLTRRDVLGGAGTVVTIALAGCTGPGGTGDAALGGAELSPATLKMEPVSDSELPSRVIYSIGVDDGPLTGLHLPFGQVHHAV